jgi:hypothetical protein
VTQIRCGRVTRDRFFTIRIPEFSYLRAASHMHMQARTMSFQDLASVPAHLLAASIRRGRERLPVRIDGLEARGFFVDHGALRVGERARVSIACPLMAQSCEIVAEAKFTCGDRTWLALV